MGITDILDWCGDLVEFGTTLTPRLVAAKLSAPTELQVGKEGQFVVSFSVDLPPDPTGLFDGPNPLAKKSGSWEVSFTWDTSHCSKSILSPPDDGTFTVPYFGSSSVALGWDASPGTVETVSWELSVTGGSAGFGSASGSHDVVLTK